MAYQKRNPGASAPRDEWKTRLFFISTEDGSEMVVSMGNYLAQCVSEKGTCYYRLKLSEDVKKTMVFDEDWITCFPPKNFDPDKSRQWHEGEKSSKFSFIAYLNRGSSGAVFNIVRMW